MQKTARQSIAMKLVAAMFVTLTIGSVTNAEPAQALSPNQTTASGVVSYLGFTSTGSIENFWRLNFNSWGISSKYVKPGIYWYNRYNGDDYNLGTCGSTTSWHNNGFHCAGNIYLDQRFMQSLLVRYGDYAVGGFLAHEWGHHIQQRLGYANRGFRSEYHADCLAGMYTRYGYATGRLVGSDYGEAKNWLLGMQQSTTHGSPTERAAWYEYGYTQYSLAACNRVFA